MADYTIAFARSARKELEKLPPVMAGRIVGRIETLAKTPRPVNSLKLHGQWNLWRMRVGDYRVVYAIDDVARTVDVSVIRHRRDVYRDF